MSGLIRAGGPGVPAAFKTTDEAGRSLFAFIPSPGSLWTVNAEVVERLENDPGADYQIWFATLSVGWDSPDRPPTR
jgi:hypothetical protein